MTNQQRIAALAIARADGTGHAPLRWVWPGSGITNALGVLVEGDLPRNCFDTQLPTVKAHPSAVKCDYTPLPGRANKRQLRKARARDNSSRRARAT